MDKPKMIFTGKVSYYFDLFRWLAALMVLIGHIKALFFVELSKVHEPSLIIKILYFIFSRGHQSVIVFFILSGLFISAGVINSLKGNTWNWKIYLINRLVRLYTVLIPALILGMILDKVGMSLYSNTGIYQGHASDKFILNYSIENNSNWLILIGNLFYLQGILIPVYGSNSPLWSLSYEFWYYIIFPIIAMTWYSKLFRNKIVMGLITLLLFAFVGKEIGLYFFIWILGFIVLLIPQNKIKSMKTKIALLGISVLFFVISLPLDRLIHKAIADFMVGISFSFIVYTILLIFNGKQIQKKNVDKYVKNMAGFSYTLYLVHFPILVFLHALNYSFGEKKWQPDIIHTTFGVLIMMFVLCFAWLISIFTESKTLKIKKAILSSFFKLKKTHQNVA
ncbi:acyltransferase family protein [Neobacillus cucumis]|uniref:Acyltransferase 3 domain-containing protein n=1 Tax=Neobacillus cucumis TaxID=1740721 RepID=A0A2N5H9X0_9BACI|nr:acyltransferase [Neobacillus cucumis]PLS02317.1 hypothetical protein CVD27_20260 [Neobacillus cucumis]